MSCPPERFPLTLSFTSNIVSHFRCAEQNTAFVSKLASKEKMQSISRERKYPPGTLLHVNWSKKCYLLCITFAACSDSFRLKDTVHRKAAPFGTIHILSVPQAYHALQPVPSTWSPIHRDSLWAFKNCISVQSESTSAAFS